MPDNEEKTPDPHPHVDVDKVYGWALRREAVTSPEKGDAAPSKNIQFRKYFLYILIGGVVLSAGISIVAILIGQINDYIARALWTTFLMVIHALIALAFISVAGKQHTRGQEIVINTLFGLTIASFFTSTLGAWNVITGLMSLHLYQIYFNTLIAAFVVQVLLSVKLVDQLTNRFMRAAIWLTITMWAYLIPAAFDNSYSSALPAIYYRGISALGIALGTTIVLVVIFHQLYVSKHPELKAAAQGTTGSKGMPLWLIILLIILGLPALLVVLGVIFLLVQLRTTSY